MLFICAISYAFARFNFFLADTNLFSVISVGPTLREILAPPLLKDIDDAGAFCIFNINLESDRKKS